VESVAINRRPLSVGTIRTLLAAAHASRRREPPDDLAQSISEVAPGSHSLLFWHTERVISAPKATRHKEIQHARGKPHLLVAGDHRYGAWLERAHDVYTSEKAQHGPSDSAQDRAVGLNDKIWV